MPIDPFAALQALVRAEAVRDRRPPVRETKPAESSVPEPAPEPVPDYSTPLRT
ncbi:hypothetical protein ACIQNU_27960 [Streptomyces sp. NPDC091292]|uniref:hypothetical protein n=1 Tax=Streptomyces sp. NPDC091292 TaxID=3365991 RepID=UPI00381BAC2F